MFDSRSDVLGLLRVALLLEYCGTRYHGSQFQGVDLSGGEIVTVQSALLQALVRLNIRPLTMMMAGRTDAGVHARGQVVHFDVEAASLLKIGCFHTSLNSVLPPDISVRGVKIGTAPRFHSTRDAQYKWYRYKIHLTPKRSVWTTPDALWLKDTRRPLIIERMKAAARLIQGKHCFKSFQCQGSQDANSGMTNDVCDIIIADFHEEMAKNGEFPGKLLIFDIVGDRFLYKMVRNLVGQFLLIGHATPDWHPQAQDPQSILTVLHQQDRTRASAPAKANGLSLMAIHYPEPFRYFGDDPLVQTLGQWLDQALYSGHFHSGYQGHTLTSRYAYGRY